MSARSLGFGLLLGALLFAAGWPLLGCHSETDTNTCGMYWPGNLGEGRTRIGGSAADNTNGYAFSCGGGDAPDWAYFWTADTADDYVFDASDSDYDTVLGLMNEDCSMELACDNDSYPIGYGLSQFVFHAKAGQRYVVVADGANGETGFFHIRVRHLDGSGP